jgi:hypothetical protein
MQRVDARIGIRLDNGNHTPQGEYQFDSIFMIGKHRVTDGGVFFGWVGAQGPSIHNCSASFVSGMHVGPLGVDGDRFEPNAEGEVLHSRDKDWD